MACVSLLHCGGLLAQHEILVACLQVLGAALVFALLLITQLFGPNKIVVPTHQVTRSYRPNTASTPTVTRSKSDTTSEGDVSIAHESNKSAGQASSGAHGG